MTHLKGVINDVKKFSSAPSNKRVKQRILHRLYSEEKVEAKRPKNGIYAVTSASLIRVRSGKISKLRSIVHVRKKK